ncbi:Phosphatidylserine decarboxylase [Fulvivirga imtechensis AK7]|uniref:Phosphatidylserine decarboxylase n=1 Tax=Fulvivirga imtechensis AK7 TaxID=1237149 RepID=L8K1Q2_9BACT|nr:phosphatidylserine decarboxylase [Fulvivirga imtechensis]ELR73859.1 Phosphatidylserine decarboxylase [Fulvivirga imtechensis AK7]
MGTSPGAGARVLGFLNIEMYIVDHQQPVIGLKTSSRVIPLPLHHVYRKNISIINSYLNMVLYRFISLHIWGQLPALWQKMISSVYARVYNHAFTRFIIKPYCRFNGLTKEYLSQFQSESGNANYSSFQDFFTRVYKKGPITDEPYIWPCEGLLCDYGRVDELPAINVKGDIRLIHHIFGNLGKDIPGHYFFSNVFLHNNNYHRIHSPVNCIVEKIERIPGELILLRPWVYKKDPSLPALRNERVNLQLTDDLGRPWHLSIVGGPAVGTIVLDLQIKPGASMNVADEIGKFLLGSTCCMASPESTVRQKGDQVFMGLKY